MVANGNVPSASSLSKERRIMKINKKAITLLVLATLLMALIPVMPMASAITAPTVHKVKDGEAQSGETNTGDKGDKMAVIGSGVTAGATVELYWDAVGDWDGIDGFLNSSKAKSSGSYEIWITVPEAVAGNHYLWVRDAHSEDSVRVTAPFVVYPKAGGL